MTRQNFEELIETIKTGDPEKLIASRDAMLRMWQSVPIEELLSLKEQFRKLNMEHREAHLEELLVSIAEKRPGPFTKIVTEPGHPLWRPALEVLSLLESDDYLDLFISLIPLCPKKDICELVRAIGCYRCSKSSKTLASLLSADDDDVFLEAVLALKRCGGPGAIGPLRNALERKRREGSAMTSMVEAVLREMGAPENSESSLEEALD